MLLLRTARFRKDYRGLPLEVRKRVRQALERFVSDPSHPSLRVKKMEGASGIWELRVSASYRITFEPSGGGVLLRRVGAHDVLRRP